MKRVEEAINYGCFFLYGEVSSIQDDNPAMIVWWLTAQPISISCEEHRFSEGARKYMVGAAFNCYENGWQIEPCDVESLPNTL